ncbi:MAG: hypothetical protein KIS94_03660 [Chitinophagales bacterium]|nr:hypothetical protein [Chitinophagales bacterium]
MVPFKARSQQTANFYTFTTETGAALESFTTGNSTQIFTYCADDNASSVISIGFTFAYEGVNYTQFSANSNGLLRLGASAVQNNATNTQLGTSNGNHPKIAPLWDDWWLPYASSSSNHGWVRYMVTGSSPNRILKIEWRVRNYSSFDVSDNWWCGTGSWYHSYDKQFQAWLYEGTNVIEFRYGSGTTMLSASIGISGSNGTQYMARNHATNHSAASSGVVTNITAWPGSGRLYRFTPPVLCTAPTVSSTTTASSIGCTSATSGGNVSADNGCAVTERGVVYATTTGPTTANSKVSSGTGTGTFSANITGLAVGTTYYVRAYAINSNGTSYGPEISFTTLPVPGQPTVISPTTACANTATTFTTSATNSPTSFTWTLPGGWTGSSSTASISATPNSTSGSISVTATNACGTSSPRTTAITITNPVAPTLQTVSPY